MIRGRNNPEPVLYKGEEWVIVGQFGSYFIVQNPKTGYCISANAKELTFLSDGRGKERAGR